MKRYSGVLLQPDWTRAWHTPLLPVAQQVWQAVHDLGSVYAALNAQPCAAGVRFVPQSALPEGMAYEQFIYTTRQVPTRDNLHDYYNGLMWLHFPQTKRRLNALQFAELERMGGVQSTRGPVRDALTLFDENVLLMHTSDALWQALAWKRWDVVFGALRSEWASTRLVLFGHAALEQLVQPFKGITAHVYRIPQGVEDWDGWLAQHLTAENLAAKPYAHLPVLGVPGWWQANTDASFYQDPQVFRALRKAPTAAVLG